ncbi:hypothetical protein RHMOL_Rhmol13G0091100 [Rhododendron molle]|nr:hypothetical protein RHMOL_Rhmol13G0091100 [Rhododendron molle]
MNSCRSLVVETRSEPSDAQSDGSEALHTSLHNTNPNSVFLMFSAQYMHHA